MKIERRFTKENQSAYADIAFRTATSEIKNPDGSVVFRLENINVPAQFSQVAADILAQKYFRKAGVARRSKHGVRLIGNAALSVKLDIEVAGASSGAKAAVEKAGGSVTTTFEKKVYMNKKGEPGKRQQRRADSAKKRAERQGQPGATA